MSTLTPDELQSILNWPGCEPPPGQEINFSNPKSISFYIFIAIGSGLSFATLAIAVKMYTKRYIFKMLGWEDYTALLAWAMFVGYCVPCVYAARYGGAHLWNTRLGDVFHLLYYANIVEILYGPTIFTVKFSILIQYLRVFVPSRVGNMPMYIGIHIVLWSNFIFYSIETFIEIFSCTPRARAWNKFHTGHCLDVNAAIIATAAFNVISDFAILLLPMYSIWQLQLPKKRKVGICALFGTGLLACMSSAARLGYSILLVTSNDASWNLILVGTWTTVEISIGIICSCLPVMPIFFKTIRQKIFGITSFEKASRTRKLTTVRKSFREVPDEDRIVRDKNFSSLANPYGSHLTSDDNNNYLESWNRVQGSEGHTVTITSPSLKPANVYFADGQIIQTRSFNVQQSSLGDGNDCEAAL